MTEAERYLLLGLQLGRHVDGLVDAYYGPPELQAQADSGEPVSPAHLAREADALLADVDDGWLGDQVKGAATYAHVLAGESISYADEVEACLGVRPTRWDESVYATVHEQLDGLLPGDGSLVDRREAWREANAVPTDRLVPLMRDVVAELRTRAAALFGLPDGEELTLEEVRDEPWWAFNYYLGDLRSRVVINADIPTTFDDVFELAAHEAYPGHHTEGSTKEQLLVREQGLIEQALLLVPTPQSLIAEGIAETAMDVLGDDARTAVLEIVRTHGFEYDAERGRAIRAALAPLRRLGVDAGLLIHEDGASTEDALAHMMRWGVMSRPRAEQSIRFVTDPTWRAYVLTYSSGGELVHAFHRNDPARFKRLLGEQIRVGELVEAAA